jgi:quercetin dioxygenase-like cupin family protein
MWFHHLYADSSGESHWRKVELVLQERSFAPPAQRIFISEPEVAKAFVFLSLKSGWDEPSHRTPKRQILFCLAGAVRVTASDGDTRDIGQGDVWRMEDVIGKGHHTRVTSEVDFEAAVVQFD